MDGAAGGERVTAMAAIQTARSGGGILRHGSWLPTWAERHTFPTGNSHHGRP